MITQAAVLFNINEPLKIIELAIPKLKKGQVLVEIKYSGACGTQLGEISGKRGEDKFLPHCLGHEGVGKVLELGAEVTKVSLDDKVVLSWIKGSGIDAGGTVYKSENLNVNSGPVTTFQRHAVVSENRLTKMPKNISDEYGVMLGCSAPTGMGSVKNILSPEPDTSAIIFGGGAVGLSACLSFREYNLKKIIVVDPVQERLNLAISAGATNVINTANDEEIINNVNQLVPNGLDYAVESVGKPEIIPLCMTLLKRQGGKLVVIGNSPAGKTFQLKPEVFNLGKSILGSWGGNSNPDLDFNEYSKTLNNSTKFLQKLISKTYMLENINEALSDLSNGRVGRPLIRM